MPQKETKVKGARGGMGGKPRRVINIDSRAKVTSARRIGGAEGAHPTDKQGKDVPGKGSRPRKGPWVGMCSESSTKASKEESGGSGCERGQGQKWQVGKLQVARLIQMCCF